MAYTDIDKPEDYFNTKLYTGTGATQSITGVGFQPDLLWIRNRFNSGRTARAIDSVRGVGKLLNIAGSADEDTQADTVTSFDSDGFSLGADSSEYGVNDNTGSHVAWSWKAGTSFTNDASATGIGNIDSTGSVNTDAGFSVISYTGDANADNTVAHGLGSVPKMIILKNRSISSNWMVYHASTGAQAPLFLNLTNAAGSGDPDRFKVVPTSSVFTPGTAQEGNGNGNSIIAYCFAEKQGYSKFGSYTGNDNADGTFVYTGFAPAWVMIKRTNSVNDWLILDTKRNPINPSNERILANTNAAASTANTMVDFLSNGFKPRSTYGGINGDSDNFIYMAFAESPLVNSNGIPNNAQ